MTTKIGDLNSKWVILFKVAQVASLILSLIIIPWGTWVTVNLFEVQRKTDVQQAWMDQGPRFTQKDADNLRLAIHNYIMETLETKLTAVLDANNLAHENIKTTLMVVKENQAVVIARLTAIEQKIKGN